MNPGTKAHRWSAGSDEGFGGPGGRRKRLARRECTLPVGGTTVTASLYGESRTGSIGCQFGQSPQMISPLPTAPRPRHGEDRLASGRAADQSTRIHGLNFNQPDRPDRMMAILEYLVAFHYDAPGIDPGKGAKVLAGSKDDSRMSDVLTKWGRARSDRDDRRPIEGETPAP